MSLVNRSLFQRIVDNGQRSYASKIYSNSAVYSSIRDWCASKSLPDDFQDRNRTITLLGVREDAQQIRFSKQGNMVSGLLLLEDYKSNISCLRTWLRGRNSEHDTGEYGIVGCHANRYLLEYWDMNSKE